MVLSYRKLHTTDGIQLYNEDIPTNYVILQIFNRIYCTNKYMRYLIKNCVRLGWFSNYQWIISTNGLMKIRRLHKPNVWRDSTPTQKPICINFDLVPVSGTYTGSWKKCENTKKIIIKKRKRHTIFCFSGIGFPMRRALLFDSFISICVQNMFEKIN